MSQKVDWNMIFTDYWKVLVLIFSMMGNKFFFELKIDGKMIFTVYWVVLVLNILVKGNNGLFFSQKVDGKMILTWSFWAFDDIPGLGKHCFSWSDIGYNCAINLYWFHIYFHIYLTPMSYFAVLAPLLCNILEVE